MRKVIIIQAAILICFWLVFLILQNPTVYNNTLGLVANNWHNENGERTLTHTPYEKLTNNNYIQWDGNHYYEIRNHGYDIEKAGGDYIYAFFPLFPFIWKISFLPPVGVLFLNYLFFSISILILLKLFSENKNYMQNLIISLCMPSLIIYFIPYTEATFMFMASIGIYGFVKNKYWLFFMGFCLVALTRPSFSILLVSIVCTDFFYYFRHKQISTLLRNTTLRILPLIVGTIIMSLIQLFQNSGSLFKFIESQKYWTRIFAIPHKLNDWSHESFAIDIGVIFILFVSLITLLVILFNKQLTQKEETIAILEYKNPRSYLSLLSIIYVIGNVLFILFFQGGNLHSLFRYCLCSPFFFLLLYTSFNYINHVQLNFRFFVISTLSLVSLFVLGLAEYSPYWNFSDLGIFIFIGATCFWIFQDLQSNIFYKIGVVLLLLINIVWTTYLFNTYIIDGWLYA